MQKRFPSVLVFSKDNEGVSAARNLGLAKRTGSMFYSLTRMMHICLIPCLCWLKRLNEIKLRWCLSILRRYSRWLHRGRPVEYSFPDVKQVLGMSALSMIYAEHIGYFSWAFMYDRQFLVDLHILYPQGFALLEDALFLNKILRQCSRVAYVSKPCYRYRITEGSLSKRTSLATVDSAFKSLSEIQTNSAFGRFLH